MDNSRAVLFEIPDYLQDKLNMGKAITDMVTYNPSNKIDNEEYRDYVRFLDILDDMNGIVESISSALTSVSEPEQQKIYARIIVLHNLTLLLQKTIEKMKAKQMTGGRESLSYSNVEEQKTMNKILKLDGLQNAIITINENRPYADMEHPDPFSASHKGSHYTIDNSSLIPIQGGTRIRRCKRKMNKKYTGGEQREITHSDLQANREINKIVNNIDLIRSMNQLNKNRPYADTTFPDPFSTGVPPSSSLIQSTLGTQNMILPQLGGKKNK